MKCALFRLICGGSRDFVRLGRYDHTRRPYAGPGTLAAQIEERCAELAFLRTMWPRGPTQPTGAAPETGARTDDEALGGVGSQGVAQGPMVDTDTAGTFECEVQAGASDAEGCGMDASDDFEVFERTAASELSADGMTGSTAARYAAEHTAEDTEDGTARDAGCGREQRDRWLWSAARRRAERGWRGDSTDG